MIFSFNIINIYWQVIEALLQNEKDTEKQDNVKEMNILWISILEINKSTDALSGFGYPI